MARGAESKEKITAEILKTFPGAFKYEKEIRIPIVENGETIQIKCVLTAAKVNVSNGDDTAIPGVVTDTTGSIGGSVPAKDFMQEPSAEEKQRVEDLCKKLGIVD